MSNPDRDHAPHWRGNWLLASGIAALIVLFSVFTAWGVFAAIHGAVTLNATVSEGVPAQSVRHPVGGAVESIHVRDGQTVRQGDVLIRLDGRRTRAELNSAERQIFELRARKARLIAERDEADEIGLKMLTSADALVQTDVASVLAGEKRLFEARRRSHQQELSLLKDQNARFEQKIRGIQTQLVSLRWQIELIERDQIDLGGPASKQDARTAMQGQASLQGHIGRLEAEIATLRTRIAENRMLALRRSNSVRENAAASLTNLVRTERKLENTIARLRERWGMLDIRAPVSGKIRALSKLSVYSMLRPEQRLMLIGPQTQTITVIADVPPELLQDVRAGQEVLLDLSVLNQAGLSDIRGQVSDAAQGPQLNNRGARGHYEAEIKLAPEVSKRLRNHGLVPGMTISVFAQIGRKSPFNYLSEPITRYFD